MNSWSEKPWSEKSEMVSVVENAEIWYYIIMTKVRERCIMPKGANQKFKLYRLAQIMCEKTDETHYLTMPEIQKELEKYDIIAGEEDVCMNRWKI